MLALKRLFLLSVLVAIARAQSTNPPIVTCPNGSNSQGSLTATGQGLVSTYPDSATVDLRVEVTRKNASEAREAGAVAVNATLAALTAQGVPAEAISTSAISLTPATQYDSATGTNKPIGITFSESIQVTLTNVTDRSVSNLITAVIAAGGDALQINGVTTSLTPAKGQENLNTARQQAVADGIKTATILAQASGITLGPIISISDQNSTPPMPAPMPGAADGAAAPETPTKYVVGKYDTQASVSMAWAICKA